MKEMITHMQALNTGSGEFDAPLVPQTLGWQGL